MKVIEIQLANGESVVAAPKWAVLGTNTSGMSWRTPGWYCIGDYVAWPCGPREPSTVRIIPDAMQLVRVVGVREVEWRTEVKPEAETENV